MLLLLYQHIHNKLLLALLAPALLSHSPYISNSIIVATKLDQIISNRGISPPLPTPH